MLFNYLKSAALGALFTLTLLALLQTAANLQSINELRHTQRLLVLHDVLQAHDQAEEVLKKAQNLPADSDARKEAVAAKATAEAALEIWARGDLDKAMEETFHTKLQVDNALSYLSCGKIDCPE